MFDIGFGELVLVFVIGLIVLGPQRLPVAVKTVAGWIRAMRSLAASVQHELSQELKLQELQDSLKKVEDAGKGTLSPELKESMEELRKTADSMKRSYQQSIDIEKEEDEGHTIHNPQKNGPETTAIDDAPSGQRMTDRQAETSPDVKPVQGTSAPGTPASASSAPGTSASGSSAPTPPASEER